MDDFSTQYSSQTVGTYSDSYKSSQQNDNKKSDYIERTSKDSDSIVSGGSNYSSRQARIVRVKYVRK